MNIELLGLLLNKNHNYDYAKTESPIERVLLNHILKFLDKETKVEVQHRITTISGNFRADIALIRKNKIVIIECDGKEHHTKEIDDRYDEWRDALIIIQKKASVIYRISGRDIYNNIYNVFSVINHFDPDVFDANKINRLHKSEIYWDWYKKYIDAPYVNNYDEVIQYTLEIKRKDIQEDFDRFWLKYAMYSLLYRDKNIYELIEIMKIRDHEIERLIEKLNTKYPNLNLTDEKQLLV